MFLGGMSMPLRWSEPAGSYLFYRRCREHYVLCGDCLSIVEYRELCVDYASSWLLKLRSDWLFSLVVCLPVKIEVGRNHLIALGYNSVIGPGIGYFRLSVLNLNCSGGNRLKNLLCDSRVRTTPSFSKEMLQSIFMSVLSQPLARIMPHNRCYFFHSEVILGSWI